jgi:hypothetical protein
MGQGVALVSRRDPKVLGRLEQRRCGLLVIHEVVPYEVKPLKTRQGERVPGALPTFYDPATRLGLAAYMFRRDRTGSCGASAAFDWRRGTCAGGAAVGEGEGMGSRNGAAAGSRR